MFEEYVAKQRTLPELCELASDVREENGVVDYFDPLFFLELVLPQKYPTLSILVMADEGDKCSTPYYYGDDEADDEADDEDKEDIKAAQETSFLLEDALASTTVFEGDGERQEILVCLSASTYDGARTGMHRERFTVVHEIAHVLLHSDKSSRLYRVEKGATERYNEDKCISPEWQANELAAELLAPVKKCVGLTVLEIMQIFGISKEAAKIRYNRAKRYERK